MEQPLQLLVEANGIVVLKFIGDLLDADVAGFASSLGVASMAISHQFKDKGKKVRVLLDLVDFSGRYSAGALDALTAFAVANTPYIEKTASYGGSDSVKTAGEIVSNLAHRDNIKLFDTKEEAVAWLEL